MTALLKYSMTCLVIFTVLQNYASSAAWGETIVLHPSDISENNGFDISSASWGADLDSEDHTAYASGCCSGPGLYFYVHLDDSSGLDDASIKILSVKITVLARYLAGLWYGAEPVADSIDYGFRTGSATIWDGDVTISDSGAYETFTSATYYTDSDGGPLDATDINNLQIAVIRNAAGPQQLRVTEVYAEVAYTTVNPKIVPILNLLTKQR